MAKTGHNSTAIPEDLKQLDQWLGWKDTKRPRVCFDDFRFASTSTEQDLSPYTAALAAVANGDLDGLGFCVTPYDPITIVDLDGCLDADGKLSAYARELVDLADSYTELSNSGRGLHIVCKGILGANYKRIKRAEDDPPAVEFFGTAGYVILTGRVFENRARLRKIPSTELSQLVARSGATAAQTKQYLSTEPPETLPDVSLRDFDHAAAFGHFLPLILHGDDADPNLVGRLPRDRDGGLDRSRAIFGAAHQAKAAGRTAAETFALLEQSAWVQEFLEDKSSGWLWKYVIEPVYKGSEGQVAVQSRAERARFVTGWELLQSVRPVDWLVEGYLERGAVGVVVGKRSSYKSALALDWAHSVATGTPWLGTHPVAGGPVVVIAGEGTRGLARRSHAWFKAHNIDPDTAHPMVWSTAAVRVMDPEELARATDAINQLLEDNFDGRRPAMVLVDTMAKNFVGGDENSSADTGRFFGDLTRAFPGSAIVVVHHQGKDATKGSRGSSAIEADVDFLFDVAYRGGQIRVTCGKMKDADAPPEAILSPEVVQLQFGEIETTGVTVRPSFALDAIRVAFEHMRKHTETALELYRVLEERGETNKTDLVGLFEGEVFGGFEEPAQRRALFDVVRRMVETGKVKEHNGILEIPEDGEE